VYLIGMPGCGKSSAGRELASLLDMPFVDLDAEIVREAGKTIPEVFREDGEEHFRDLESDALARVASGPAAVVACGGGMPLREGNRETMHRTGTVVWLNVPLASLRRRIRDLLDARPLVKDPLDLERIFRQREATYRTAADHEVPADDDPKTVAKAVAEVVA
jgi:shikimate kinase